MRSVLRINASCLLGLLISLSSFASITLPNVIGSNMVLQSNARVKIWGKAAPAENVIVTFRDQTVSTVTDSSSNWSLYIGPFPADNINTYTLTVTGTNILILTNILCGDVWLCAGQSNMQWKVRDSNNSVEEIANAANSRIRLFLINPETSGEVKNDVEGRWVECSPQTVPNFTAAGYFFGKNLYEKTGIPLGLIMSAYGGSKINSWMSKESLLPLNAYDLTGNKANVSSGIYNAMIYPLHRVSLKGVLWYQGETGGSIPKKEIEEAYRILFEKMISDWRMKWNNPELPFIFAQLSSDDTVFVKGRRPNTADSWYSRVRGAQWWVSKSVANTGMAVTYDIGDINSVHYRNKQEAGRRLSLVARALVYGEKKLVYSGPLFDHAVIKGNKVVLHFTNCGKGLEIKTGQNGSAFLIAGEDMKFVKGEAVIKGKTVIVSAPGINKPVEVRYAWYDIPYKLSYLYNKEGLPAASFRTGGARPLK